MIPRKQPKDYHALAKKHGFQWLGPTVRNAHLKTKWECPQGHTWRTTYDHIRAGHGCSHCAGRAKKTEADYYALATSRGFQWIGKLPKNVNHKTKWQCSEGHTWQAKYPNIKAGQGCPRCYGNARLTADDYYVLAELRGFKLIGSIPKSANHRATWECQHGHKWKARYRTITAGHGCKRCSAKAGWKKRRKNNDCLHNGQ